MTTTIPFSKSLAALAGFKSEGRQVFGMARTANGWKLDVSDSPEASRSVPVKIQPLPPVQPVKVPQINRSERETAIPKPLPSPDTPPDVLERINKSV